MAELAQIKTRYGLKIKGKDRILGIRKESNEDKDYTLNDHAYILDEWEGYEEPWTTDDYDKALMAKWTSEDWYNSSYEEPVNPYHPSELVVLEIRTEYIPRENAVEDELTIVNETLKQDGYAEIDVEKYQEK